MSTPVSVSRPTDLPDFESPPLEEVVLGVQFFPPSNYSQILAGEVWKLFRDDYPLLEEKPPLETSFETFGGPSQQFSGPKFTFNNGGQHDRFWFIEPNGTELIQFQQDRILHNWRKMGNSKNQYPRYESMITKFSDELARFESFISSITPQRLTVNQAEISYINQIPLGSLSSGKRYSFISFLNFNETQPNDLSINFRENILDSSGRPYARLICELVSGQRTDGSDVGFLTISVKGAPLQSTIESALEFLSMGRTLIVKKFAELTTTEAHEHWGRIK